MNMKEINSYREKRYEILLNWYAKEFWIHEMQDPMKNKQH